MKKKTRKIALCFLIGLLLLSGNVKNAKAEEQTASIGVAQVNTFLNIRSAASVKSEILGKVYNNGVVTVIAEKDGWYQVKTGKLTGYAKADYVLTGKKAEEIASKSENKTNVLLVSKTDTSRNKIVEYALRFKGNPYVWGGTSLTKGTDCSGFTQSVFRDNGISIPRTSRTQATAGKVVSISSVKPGDLIFYSRSGTINHVAIYIGNGKVIGASNPQFGIRICKYNYRQPYKAVSYIK